MIIPSFRPRLLVQLLGVSLLDDGRILLFCDVLAVVASFKLEVDAVFDSAAELGRGVPIVGARPESLFNSLVRRLEISSSEDVPGRLDRDIVDDIGLLRIE